MIASRDLYYTHRSTREIYELVRSVTGEQAPNERYCKKAIQQMLHQQWITVSFQEWTTPYYSLTDEGRKVFRDRRKAVVSKLKDCQVVARRILYDITRDGEMPSQFVTLEGKDRTFFSYIVSTKDIFRFYVLQEAMKQPYIVMADMMRSIEDHFGWTPSRGYVYQLAMEMEDDTVTGPLLKGKWEDPRMRTRRFWKITEDGYRFFPRLKQDTADRARSTIHYIDRVTGYLEK